MRPPQPLIRFTIEFWLNQALDQTQAWLILHQLTTEKSVDTTTSMIAIYGVILFFVILAWVMITYATSNIARWLYSAWVFFMIGVWPFGFAELKPVEQALSVVSIALCAYALFLLHRPAVRELFRSSEAPRDVAAVFE